MLHDAGYKEVNFGDDLTTEAEKFLGKLVKQKVNSFFLERSMIDKVISLITVSTYIYLNTVYYILALSLHILAYKLLTRENYIRRQ